MAEKNLPARLPATEIMPLEKHYQSPRFWGRRPGELMAFISFLILVFTGLSLSLPMWFMFSFVLAVGVGSGVSTWSRTFKGASENIRGQMLLMSGKVEEAGELFEGLTKSYPDHPHHALFVHNRAVSLLLLGQPKRALSILNAVHQSGRFKSRMLRPFQDHLCANRALCLALLGQIQEADTLLREIESQDSATFGFTVLTRGIIEIRRGDPDFAIGHIMKHWRVAEGIGYARSVRGLRAVGALAASQVGDDAKARQLIAGLYPMTEGELDWMMTSWPELKTFVSQSRLGASH